VNSKLRFNKPAKTAIKNQKLEIKTGNQNWKSKLEIKTGNQNWKSKLEIKTGNQNWKSEPDIRIEIRKKQTISL